MIYQPRPYQDLIINAGLDTRRLNIFASVGVGKTSASYMLFDKLRMLGLAKRALVLGPKRVALSAWPAERTKWFDTFGHLKVAVAIGTPEERLRALLSDADILTMNYENVEWLIDACGGRLPFDTVFADECFVAGTKVTTPNGTTPIEQLQVGDVVSSAHGPKEVVRVYRKTSKEIVRLHLSNGDKVVCTGSHPIWTSCGWTEAVHTEGSKIVGPSDLPTLWRTIRNSCSEGNATEPGQILFAGLQHQGMAVGEARRVVSGASENTPASHVRARGAQRRRPDKGNNTGEAVIYRQGPRGQLCEIQRGQRSRDDNLRKIVGPTPDTWVGVEHSAADQGIAVARLGRTAYELQAGLLLAEPDGLLGSRREQPPNKAREGTRREEDVSIGSTWVVCVENIECRSPVAVYDIEVADSHTYFAGGILVHNCTRLKSHRISLQTSKLGNEFLKGQGSKRAGALAKLAFGGEVVNWFNLTGTPSPNGLQDLWGQMFFIDRGKRLGHSFTAFEQRWFRTIKSQDGVTIRSEPMPWAEQQIKDLIRDVSITIDARDWFPIEEPIERHIEVDLPPKARKAYREMEREMFTDLLEHDVEALNGGGKVNKCRQIASGSVFYDQEGRWQHVHDEKLDALRSLVSETMGENLLVAYQFTPERDAILKAFPNARFLDANPQTLVDWNAGKIPMLVCHPASAGHGLSLQDGGRILVDYSTGWDLELDEQVLGRIGPTRQLQSGYKRSVFRYRIVARDTVEDQVVIPRLKSKASVQDSLLAAMKRLA